MPLLITGDHRSYSLGQWFGTSCGVGTRPGLHRMCRNRHRTCVVNFVGTAPSFTLICIWTVLSTGSKRIVGDSQSENWTSRVHKADLHVHVFPMSHSTFLQTYSPIRTDILPNVQPPRTHEQATTLKPLHNIGKTEKLKCSQIYT